MRKKKDDKKNKSLTSVVGEIFKTTDGFFDGKPHITKPRRVTATEQRQDDGAIVVAKIMSKKNKESKIGKEYIPDLVLNPKDHPAITEESIVESRVRIGVKRKGNSKKMPIYPSDLERTGDKLSESEIKKVREGVQNDTPQHRETHNKTIKNWHNHFEK